MYSIEQIIEHARNRDYMSGVERDKSRVRQTAEVFTPTFLAQEMLDLISEEEFSDKTKTFLDPTCGDGQFLSEILIRKMEHGSTYEEAISTIYGVDLMLDNCIECIKRLYMVKESQINILTDCKIPIHWQTPGIISVFSVSDKIVNIVNADALTYDFSFGKKSFSLDNFF